MSRSINEFNVLVSKIDNFALQTQFMKWWDEAIIKLGASYVISREVEHYYTQDLNKIREYYAKDAASLLANDLLEYCEKQECQSDFGTTTVYMLTVLKNETSPNNKKGERK